MISLKTLKLYFSTGCRLFFLQSYMIPSHLVGDSIYLYNFQSISMLACALYMKNAFILYNLY